MNNRLTATISCPITAAPKRPTPSDSVDGTFSALDGKWSPGIRQVDQSNAAAEVAVDQWQKARLPKKSITKYSGDRIVSNPKFFADGTLPAGNSNGGGNNNNNNNNNNGGGNNNNNNGGGCNNNNNDGGSYNNTNNNSGGGGTNDKDGATNGDNGEGGDILLWLISLLILGCWSLQIFEMLFPLILHSLLNIGWPLKISGISFPPKLFWLLCIGWFLKIFGISFTWKLLLNIGWLLIFVGDSLLKIFGILFPLAQVIYSATAKMLQFLSKTKKTMMLLLKWLHAAAMVLVMNLRSHGHLILSQIYMKVCMMMLLKIIEALLGTKKSA